MAINLLTALLAVQAATAACELPLQRTVALMGTTLTASVCAETSEDALAASEAAFRAVKRLEDVLSSWTATSEVGRLNSAPAGATVQVSKELYTLLRETGGWVTATDNAFDPAIGALVDAWQLRGAVRTPGEAELTGALARTGWGHLALRDSLRVVRGPAGWWLDTGGFGKGAALRAAAARLASAGVHSAVLNFGGQLLVLGADQVIAVADPRARATGVIELCVRDVSVATSSQSERARHILDPRTGRPVPAWGSVTVVARDAMTADVLSTALFVMGPRAALEWARNRSDIGVLILENTDHAPRASWNDAMTRWIIKER